MIYMFPRLFQQFRRPDQKDVVEIILGNTKYPHFYKYVLFSLRKIFVNSDSFKINLFGADNIIDLMYCRIGQCELDWENGTMVDDILDGIICEFHFEELVTKWESRFSGHVAYNNQKKLTCLYNHIFTAADNRKCPNLVQQKIRKDDAIIFVKDEIVIQLGAGRNIVFKLTTLLRFRILFTSLWSNKRND